MIAGMLLVVFIMILSREAAAWAKRSGWHMGDEADL